MALAERNHPLTGTRGPMVILEWTWFQWVSGLTATIAPAVVVLGWMDQRGGSSIVNLPNGFSALLAVINGYLFYVAMQMFDGVGTWSLRWVLGTYMKLVAILHAVGAMYLIAQTRDGLITPTGVEVPDGLIWLGFGICWAIAGVSYLVGDAHIRIGQREAQSFTLPSVKKPLPTPSAENRQAGS